MRAPLELKDLTQLHGVGIKRYISFSSYRYADHKTLSKTGWDGSLSDEDYVSHLVFLLLQNPRTLVDMDISCSILSPNSLSGLGFLTQYSRLFGALLGNLSAPLIRVLNTLKSPLEIASATSASLQEHLGTWWIYRSTLSAFVTW